MVRTACTRSLPFAAIPHGLASDRRLSPTDRLTVTALLYWALGATQCTMSNRRLAGYVGCSVSTIERSLRSLKQFGYIRTEKVRPTESNMTGRVIHLLWVAAPELIPDPPARGRVRHQRGTRSIVGEGEGPSPARVKQDPERKKEDDGQEVVVIEVLSREPEDPRPIEEPAPEAPPALAAIDPALVELIDQAGLDEATRRELASHLPHWVALFTVARIILAIKEGAERRKRNEIRYSLAGYIGKTLANWNEGKPTPRLAKGSTSGATRAEVEARQAAEKIEKRRQAEDQASQEERLWSAWEALDVETRQGIENEVDRDQPRPGRLSTATWLAMRRALCLDRFRILQGHSVSSYL
jgi:Helix-turn-helix domain